MTQRHSLFNTNDNELFKKYFPNILKIISEVYLVSFKTNIEINLDALIQGIVSGKIGFLFNIINDEIDSLLMFTCSDSIFSTEQSIMVELIIGIIESDVVDYFNDIKYDTIYLRAIHDTDIIYKQIARK